jgi:hypothetical protein
VVGVAAKKESPRIALWIALVAMLLGIATLFLEALADLIRLFM